MNALLELLNEPLASRIGWVLLHSLWQGAVVGGIFEAARFALRARSAQSRYLAGCGVLAVLLIATVVTFLIESPPLPASGEPVPAAFDSSPSQIFAPGATDTPRTFQGDSVSFLQAGAMILSGIAPWLTAVWVIGVVFFCFQLTRSWWWVGKIRRRDSEPMDTAWLERLDALRRRMGVSRPVRLLKSAWVEVPTVIGWLRPVILLPAASLTGLTPAQLEAVLAHELAHVRRFDCVVNAFQCVVEALLFYHPVVWWISRHVREERENCCDDLVVEVCGDRVVYARALAALEVSRSELPQLAFAATGGSLLNRIRRLLGASNAYGPATGRELAGLALLGIGVLLIALGVCLPMSPKLYLSVARIIVRSSIVSQEPNDGLSHSYDPYFIQTEYEVIQSEAVLRKVIESLGLKHEWRKKYNPGNNLTDLEAMEFLRRRLELRPVRNTSVIEIRVMDDEPHRAAAIANQIAETYKEYRLQRTLDLADVSNKVLEEQKAEQNQKIEAAQSEVNRLRNALGIIDTDPASVPTSLPSREVVKQLHSSLEFLTDGRVHLETQLANLTKLPNSQLREAIQTAIEQHDAQLDLLFNRLDQAEQKLSALAGDVATNHPSYLNAEAALHDLNEKIDRRVEGILLGLQNRIDATRARIAQLEERLKNASQPDSAAIGEYDNYVRARQRLADSIAAGTALEMKISAQKTELKLPRNSPVEFMDSAVPSSRPSSFRRPATPSLVLIGLGVLFDLLGIQMLRGRSETPAVLPA